MIEREICYCFHPLTGIDAVANFFTLNYLKEPVKSEFSEDITDLYLSEDVRLRELPEGCYLYKKVGDKATTREETSCIVDPLAKDILRGQVKLTIKKRRYSYVGDGFVLSVDDVSYPMKVIIAEVEFENDSAFYKFSQNNEALKDLTPNTKNAWNYFRRKVGFSGPPSSGKTTLCRALTNKLSIDYGLPMEQVTEYARTHIARYGVPHWSIQPLIEWGQERRESDARDAVVMVTDSPSFLPYFYALYNFKDTLDTSSIFLLGKMYKGAMYAVTKYTNLVLLQPKPVKQDGIRIQTDEDSQNLFDLIETFLQQHNVPFIKTDYSINIDTLIADIFSLNKL